MKKIRKDLELSRFFYIFAFGMELIQTVLMYAQDLQLVRAVSPSRVFSRRSEVGLIGSPFYIELKFSPIRSKG